MAKDNLIKIGGELKSVAADGVVAGAEAIYDYTEGKSQATINQDLKDAIEDIDVTSQISGKADKSEMSVVAGTGANADKTTITLKSGTSATVLTQHQDVSEFIKEGEVFGTGDDTTASFNPYSDTVWNKEQVLSVAQKHQIQENIGISDVIATKADKSNTYTKSETYNKIEVNNLITTPNQEYVSVTATAQTTSVTDVLPATGAADTTYRVGNWDGTQYNDSVFSEYAWNGSAYIKLSTKSQVGEVYDISANHADTKYADLSAALDGGNNIPQSFRKGGISVKFVQSSDNKYVQYRLTKDEWSTITSDWVEVDSNKVDSKVLFVTDGDGNIIAKIDKDGVHSVDFKYGVEGNSIKRKLEDIFSSDILWGKKICCCGDSITYGADMDSEGIAQESSIDVYQSDANGNFTKVSANFRKTYGYQIAARHNMTFYNAGVSGSTMQGLSNKYGFSLADGRYTKLPSDADIITIFFGWNDNAYGTLGTIDDTTNESYYGGYNIVLPYLLEHHPYAKIILIVPYGCTEGHRNAVRLLADKWGVACFDMYQGGTPLYYGKEDYVGVKPDVVSANRAKYQAIGAHPNYKGHTAIGDMLESYLLTGIVNVDEKIKALIAKEEKRAKAAENTKLNHTIADNAFLITDSDGYIICKIDDAGVHSVNIEEEPNKIDNNSLIITDSNGYIIARIDKDGIHSVKDKHAVACMVLSESYYPIAAPTRDSDGNVTYAQVMFETGIAGSISITYTNGNSSSVAVVYGNYNYTITINRDSDGNVETVNVQ